MAAMYQCDRCGALVDNSLEPGEVPDTMHKVYRPVRGSQGAKSDGDGVICAECDDDLYLWWQRGWMEDEKRTAARQIAKDKD